MAGGQTQPETEAPLRRAAQRGHYRLELAQPPGPEIKARLEARGARVTGSLAGAGLVVEAPEGLNLEGLGVRRMRPFRPAEKLSPTLAEAPDGAYLVEFHSDVAPERAGQILRESGLLRLDHPDLVGCDFLAVGPRDRLDALAARDEVAYLFPASSDLLTGTRLVGCAGALGDGVPVGQYVKASGAWPANGAGPVELRYVFTHLSAKLLAATAESEIVRALDEWARYAPLEFSPAASASEARTISILFASGAHGDGYPFDGPGKILAHTFYPPPLNNEPLAGDMHLDADEDWQIGRNVDMYTVALHEAGHALGLGHSDQPGSVMYPYYRLGAVMSDDDIAAIRALYGSRDAAAPPSQPASPPAQPKAPSPPQTPAKPVPAADTTPPALRVIYPALSVVATSSDRITVRGSASDNVAVEEVLWSNSAGGAGTAAGTSLWSAEILLQKGTNTVMVRAYDAAGNSSWRAVTVVRR